VKIIFIHPFDSQKNVVANILATVGAPKWDHGKCYQPDNKTSFRQF
jgi:hypothetical protein